jgi:hypothetical protein
MVGLDLIFQRVMGVGVEDYIMKRAQPQENMSILGVWIAFLCIISGAI